MARMKRRFLTIPAVLAAAAGVAMAGTVEQGVVGPKTRLQVSGRLLTPIGKMTRLGNFPAGGALTPNGRFLWTLSAGRGPNDIRIVEVLPGGRCRPGRRGAACRRRRAARTGRLVQTIPMPGVTGGP